MFQMKSDMLMRCLSSSCTRHSDNLQLPTGADVPCKSGLVKARKTNRAAAGYSISPPALLYAHSDACQNAAAQPMCAMRGETVNNQMRGETVSNQMELTKKAFNT